LAAAAWFAGNAQQIGERFARLSNVALAAPFLFGGPLRDATVGCRMAWMGLRGMSEDRLYVLAADYFTDFIEPKLRAVGLALLDKAKREGRRVILISDNLEVVIRPLAAHVGADDYVCNRMELRDGKCTGRLVDPIINGNLAGKWAKQFAAENAIDLARSYAYGSEADDGLLLEAIGRPCAIHPDRQLRAMARDLDWPVVEG
jgi:phosphoserine phosphatase